MKKIVDLDEVINKKVANYLGLAQKAGKIAAGDMAAKNAIKKDNAKILIVANDIAASVMEEMDNLLQSKSIPVYIWKDKIYLGAIIGKSRRGALAVLDIGFADAIEKLFSLNKGE